MMALWSAYQQSLHFLILEANFIDLNIQVYLRPQYHIPPKLHRLYPHPLILAV